MLPNGEERKSSLICGQCPANDSGLPRPPLRAQLAASSVPSPARLRAAMRWGRRFIFKGKNRNKKKKRNKRILKASFCARSSRFSAEVAAENKVGERKKSWAQAGGCTARCRRPGSGQRAAWGRHRFPKSLGRYRLPSKVLSLLAEPRWLPFGIAAGEPASSAPLGRIGSARLERL